MKKVNKRIESRVRRHLRIRSKIRGTADRPRMSVCCTGKHIYIQFIDDVAGRTLASASTLSAEFKSGDANKANLPGAARLGKIAAERALKADVKTVVFDRGGFPYHGRVRAIGDAARECGLEF